MQALRNRYSLYCLDHDALYLHSLQKIFANLFGQKISKSQRLSNWEAETLTESQINYAATDAWACVEIYNCLAEMEETGDYEVINVENNNLDI